MHDGRRWQVAVEKKEGGEMVMNPRTGVRKVWVGEFGWELWLKSERGVAWATD